jgi:hypothetical protein
MGHAKVDTTLNMYAQVLDDSVRDAALRVGSKLITIDHTAPEVATAAHLKGLAPRAGLEPATLRLTEDGCGSDDERWSAIKYLCRQDFRPVRRSRQQLVDRGQNE